MFHYVTLKKHTQSNSKQSQTQLSSARGNPTPQKQVGQLRKGLNEAPLKKTQLPTQQQKNTALTSFLSNQAESESERITKMWVKSKPNQPGQKSTWGRYWVILEQTMSESPPPPPSLPFALTFSSWRWWWYFSVVCLCVADNFELREWNNNKKYGFSYQKYGFLCYMQTQHESLLLVGLLQPLDSFFFYLWEQPLDSYAKRSVFLRT